MKLMQGWLNGNDQFIRHKMEVEEPELFDDMKFDLIESVWLLYFIYRKVEYPIK